VHGVFTLLMFALATAYRLPCERDDRGGDPVGLAALAAPALGADHHRVIVFAQGYYGIFHLAEYSLLLGVKLNDVPPDIGSRQQVLAKYELPTRG